MRVSPREPVACQRPPMLPIGHRGAEAIGREVFSPRAMSAVLDVPSAPTRTSVRSAQAS